MITDEELIKLNSFKENQKKYGMTESDYISFKCRFKFFMKNFKNVTYMDMYDINHALQRVTDEVNLNLYDYINN